MKTSVIKVRDMLSVLSVGGVEKVIGEVPGVESVTVNFDAGSATVRYDETRLEIADIKSAVRQSGHAAEPTATAGHDHEGRTAQAATPGTHAPAAPTTPLPAAPPTLPTPAAAAAAPKSAPTAVSAAPASAVPAGDGQKHKEASGKR